MLGLIKKIQKPASWSLRLEGEPLLKSFLQLPNLMHRRSGGVFFDMALGLHAPRPSLESFRLFVSLLLNSPFLVTFPTWSVCFPRFFFLVPP